MENAAKALLIAAGVLLGILLLSLMVTLFASSSSLSRSYDEAKQAEAIQQFNSNFTKYLGKDLTRHEVETIINYARSIGINEENNKLIKVDVDGIRDIVDKYEYSEDGTDNKVTKYRLSVEFNESTGYINKVIISKK